MIIRSYVHRNPPQKQVPKRWAQSASLLAPNMRAVSPLSLGLVASRTTPNFAVNAIPPRWGVKYIEINLYNYVPFRTFAEKFSIWQQVTGKVKRLITL